MIKNNLKIISEHLKMRYPVTQIARDLGWSKGQVSQYFNDKIEMSENFKKEFANFYNINFSDFEEPDEKDSINPKKLINHMEQILFAKQETIEQMKKTIALLEDKVKDLERDNLFSTKPHPERNESDPGKKAR